VEKNTNEVLVALMPWREYIPENSNSMVISERLVKKRCFDFLQLKTIVVEARETDLGLEAFVRNIPEEEEGAIRNLDERGIILPRKEVTKGDILVGKVTPVKREDSPEYRLLYSIFREKARDVKNTSYYYPFREKGVVIEVSYFSREKNDELPPGVSELVKIYIGILQNLKIGDILTNNGYQGVVTKILSSKDMPYRRGERMDIVVDPSSDFGKIFLDSEGLSIGGKRPIVLFDGRTRGRKRWSPRPGIEKVVGERFEGRHKIGYAPFQKLPAFFEDRLEACSIGQYALIDKRPLDGQIIEEEEILTLTKIQAFQILREILTYKSDDEGGRIAVYTAILIKKGWPPPKGSEIISSFRKILQALGLEVEIDDEEVKISLASTETIRSWSFGEVAKPDTINYRTQRPERDGLFCEKIFGPIKDWKCYCGKYRDIRYKGTICGRCGVEVTNSEVRRERFGHLELVAPVVHVWFLPVIANALGISQSDLEKVVYFDNYLVLDPKETDLKKYQLLSWEEYKELKDKIDAKIGGEAIKEALIREEREEYFQKMILEVLPIFPPDLRPMIKIDGGRFATSTLNDLYRRVINRNNRLKKLIELRASKPFVFNEARMLQEAIDTLFDNGRYGRVIYGPKKQPLRSLFDELKEVIRTFFRRHQDYSAKGVVVADSKLTSSQCFLPKSIALELFLPFVMRQLIEEKVVRFIKDARELVRKEDPKAYEALERAIKERVVLLISSEKLQAFEIRLWEEETIGLSLQSCKEHGLKLKGEFVKMFLPLSEEAQQEAREIFKDPVELQKGEIPSFLSSLFPKRDLIDCLIEGIVGGKGELNQTLFQIDKLALGREIQIEP